MSKNRWKAELSYDSNYGPTVNETVYLVENNSTDFTYMYKENGDYVDIHGTDSYVGLICQIPMERDYDKTVRVTYSGWEAIISPVSWADMPPEVQKQC